MQESMLKTALLAEPSMIIKDKSSDALSKKCRCNFARLSQRSYARWVGRLTAYEVLNTHSGIEVPGLSTVYRALNQLIAGGRLRTFRSGFLKSIRVQVSQAWPFGFRRDNGLNAWPQSRIAIVAPHYRPTCLLV